MTKQQDIIEGYFENCDLYIRERLGYMYSVFLREWLFHGLTEWVQADKYVIHFQHEQLQKIDIIMDRKIVHSISRDDWLDMTYTDKLAEFSKEFTENEGKFMKYIRYSIWVTPVTDSTFIIAVVNKDTTNV